MYKCYKRENDGSFVNVNINDDIKTAFKYNVSRAFLKIDGSEELIDENNYLKDIIFDDCRFVEREGIIGGVVAKTLEGNFINIDTNTFDVENKELEFYLGAELNEEMYYLKMGKFIVQTPENNNASDNTKFEAMDYMIKFNVPYKSRVAYPCKLSDLLQDVCRQAGVSCGTTRFRNSDFLVDTELFTEGESLRDVVKAIAQVAFSWARIDEENKLLIDFDTSDIINEEITNDEYFDLKVNNEYGPVNSIILKDTQIEGQDAAIYDAESIATYGETQIVINDNPFAYNRDKRYQLIDAAEALIGFRYVPVSLRTIGLSYLNCKDKLRIYNMQGEPLETYIFDNKIKYNGANFNELETKAMTKTETQYKFSDNVSSKIKRTTLIVDKANQKIQGIIEDIGDRSEKSTTITQDIDGIENVVKNIATFKKTVSGKGQVRTDEDTAPTEILSYEIEGYKEYINQLYCGDEQTSEDVFVDG